MDQSVEQSTIHCVHSMQEFTLLTTFASSNNKLIILDASASWCGPCKAIKPYFEQLSKEYQEHYVFAHFDVDESPDISDVFQIHSMPTFIILKDSQVIEKLTGAKKDALKNILETHKNDFFVT
jgi:thioredoxin 1